MDINFDYNTDPVTGYVALSRVKRANAILILQAFSCEVFTKGKAQQPELMMKYMALGTVEERIFLISKTQESRRVADTDRAGVAKARKQEERAQKEKQAHAFAQQTLEKEAQQRQKECADGQEQA